MAPSPEDVMSTIQLTSSIQTFPLEEVAKHSTRTDAWVVYKNFVYNVTDFLESHPGGTEILLEHAGKDISDLFESPSIHEHSSNALSLLSNYRIGTLKDSASLYSKPAETDDVQDLIDLDKPIISQLWTKPITKEQYLKITHKPRFLKGGRVARFFENDFLEFCSRNEWYTVLMWLPVAGWFISFGTPVLQPTSIVCLVLFGIVIWTLTEYSLHRFLFHLDNLVPDNHTSICLHFLLHGVHHFLPMDSQRLVFPWTLVIILLQPFYYGIHSLVGYTPVSCVLAGGGLIGYVIYDLTHYYLHHAVPHLEYFKDLKTYHLNHHYKNHNSGYGITSKLWDWVFGTMGEA